MSFMNLIESWNHLLHYFLESLSYFMVRWIPPPAALLGPASYNNRRCRLRRDGRAVSGI
jgi:hypothetical protein